MLQVDLLHAFGNPTDSSNNRHPDFQEVKSDFSSRNQGFPALPFDLETADKIADFASQAKDLYDAVLVLGIGGSMLGPQALVSALAKFGAKPMILFWDNIDPDLIAGTAPMLNLSKTLILVQSKSGNTPETLAQYFYLRSMTDALGLDATKHYVFITDQDSGLLRKISNAERIPAFEIPVNVGGRFSVLTPVGLLAAALSGIDIFALLEGGRQAVDNNLDSSQSPAFDLALAQYQNTRAGRTIVPFFAYSSRLRLTSEWYVQLLSESIGKKTDRSGQTVHTGLTPLPALGVTDQHSKLQLFQDGPDDKFYIFLELAEFENQVRIGDDLPQEVAYLNRKTFNQLLAAELSGTRQSLLEAGRPLCGLKLERLDAPNVGELLVFLELSVAYLGELLHIDAFDQPGVERSKILTREILGNP